MIRETLQININSAWKIADDKAQASVTIMVEGVHYGSHGRIFWAAHVLRENTPKWDGVPVCLNHPQMNGQPVSIKQMPKDNIIGYVKHPWFDEVKKGIRARIEIEATHYGQVRDLSEVSAGVFADEVYDSGVWGSEQYEACSITMDPDHLALLTDQVGACSWEDGCGIRNNSDAFQILSNAATTYIKNLMKGDFAMSEKPLMQIDAQNPKVKQIETFEEYETRQREADECNVLFPSEYNARPQIKSSKKDDWHGKGEEPLLPPVI